MKNKITVVLAVLVLSCMFAVAENLGYLDYTAGSTDITTTGDMECTDLTVNGDLDISGDVTITGLLNTDTLDADMHINNDGTLQVDGRADFDGTVEFGNSAANDTVLLVSRIGSNLDPITNGGFSLGVSARRWDLFADDVNIADSLTVTGTADFGGNVTFDGTIATNADAIPDSSVNYGADLLVAVNGWWGDTSGNYATAADVGAKADTAVTNAILDSLGAYLDTTSTLGLWTLDTNGNSAEYMYPQGAYGIVGYSCVTLGTGGNTNVVFGTNCSTGVAGVNRPDNSIGGGKGNVITDGEGSVIAGGITNRSTERYNTIGGGYANVNGSPYGVIGGGWGNETSDTAAFIGGGQDNTASGLRSTVGGGYGNTASGSRSTVGGGQDNTASGQRSTVGGGYYNTATQDEATVAGGFYNNATGSFATISGGFGNTASGTNSAIPGGNTVNVSGNYSFGFGNTLNNSTNFNAQFFGSDYPGGGEWWVGVTASDDTLGFNIYADTLLIELADSNAGGWAADSADEALFGSIFACGREAEYFYHVDTDTTFASDHADETLFVYLYQPLPMPAVTDSVAMYSYDPDGDGVYAWTPVCDTSRSMLDVFTAWGNGRFHGDLTVVDDLTVHEVFADFLSPDTIVFGGDTITAWSDLIAPFWSAIKGSTDVYYATLDSLGAYADTSAGDLRWQPLSTVLTQLAAEIDSASFATDTVWLWRDGKHFEMLFETP